MPANEMIQEGPVRALASQRPLPKLPRKELDKWEARLEECVGEGEVLLGELGFGQAALNEIGQLLAETDFLHLRKKRYTVDKTIRHVNEQCPLTYALYLVLEGVYNYESGDYWDGPSSRLGLPSNQTHHFGRLFLDILARFNLPTFEQSGGHTYVTPILLHGGIPNDFLDRFFDFLWQQERRHHQISLDSTSLLGMWRQNPEECFRYLPKPARRFLEFGGLVAADFVERCLDLFDTNSLEEAEALVDLPSRVITAFGQWRDEKDVSTRTTASRIRLQRPVLVVAPYAAGIKLYLPVQQFPHRDAPQVLSWHLAGSQQRINCQRRRVEGGVQFEVDGPLDISPAGQYTLHLEADGKPLHTWSLPGLADPPVLFIDPYDAYEGDALIDQERFLPGKRWLLYSQSYRLKETGESKKLSELPGLEGDWKGYRLEVWQLAPGKMMLQDESGRVHSLTIEHGKARQRPYLVGGNRVQLSPAGADFPLYIGRPPALKLHVGQPHRWFVAVRAAGGAQPGGHRQKRLSQLPFTQEDGLRLELALPELLGEAPVGRFEVVIRGPLGQSYHFGLRCIPDLQVNGLSQLYLANAQETAQVRFQCDLETLIRQNPPQEGVSLQLMEKQGRREYEITAVPAIRQINLQLRHDCGVVIPLTIPIHRLRWGLWSGRDDLPVQWQTAPSAIYPEALARSVLWVDVPVVREHLLYVGWQLINAQGEICREVYPGEQPALHRLEWPLAEVTGVWRERQETLCWQLVIQPAEGDKPNIIPAFYLLPTPDFGDVTYEWQEAGEEIYLNLLWERPLSGGYQLRLWPQDRPWIDEPIELRLPETRGTLAEWCLSSKELLPEVYLAELVAYNPWQSTRPQRPQPGTSNTFLLKPSGLRHYYSEINRLRAQGQASIEQLLALLAHQFYNEQQNELYSTNQAIAEMAEILPLEWLVRWADTVRRFDSTAYKIIQLKLFKPSMIARLTQKQSKTEALEQYFAHMPMNFFNQIAPWVLRSDLQVYRLDSLKTLCSLPLANPENEESFHTAIAVLLNDVADGVLAVDQAVELLRPNQQAAVKWLIENGGLDARELLQELAVQTNLEPDWVAPGMLLDSHYGAIEITKLRHRITTETRFCAPLDCDYYAEGKLAATPTAVLVRLDLRYKLLHFPKSEPYLCLHCQELLSSLADFSLHHQSAHPELAQARKRLKQNCAVPSLRPHLVIVAQNREK